MSLTIGTATNTAEYSAIPAGLYLARLKAIEEIESRYNEGQTDLKWIFVVERVIDSNDDDAEKAVGEEIWGYSSKGASLKHKARLWAEAIRGRAYDEGETIRSDELIGKLVKISMVEHTRQDGTTTTKVGALTTHKTKRRVEEDDELF